MILRYSTYVTIDHPIEGIKHASQGCFLAKTGIESAFRLIPVHPDDYGLLSMHWKEKFYYDNSCYLLASEVHPVSVIN